MTPGYFGEPWDVPATDGLAHVDAPVGEKCLLCGEEVVVGDCGFVSQALQVMHRECELRGVLGSIGHLLKLCHCVGGTMEDVPELTSRQNARLVWAWVQTYGPLPD